jgi:hypothetical protein
MTKALTTEQLAAGLGLKPQTLRAAFCRYGHYCNVVPTKGSNRFLYWPADSVERITGQAEKRAAQ